MAKSPSGLVGRVVHYLGTVKVGTACVAAIVLTLILGTAIYTFSEDKSKGDSKSAMFDLFECTPRNGLVLVDPGVIARVKEQLQSPRIQLPPNMNDGDTLEVAMPAQFWSEKDNDFAFASLAYIDDPGDPDDVPTDETQEILYAERMLQKKKQLHPNLSFLVKLSRCGGFTVKGYFVENLEVATGIRTVQAIETNEVFLTADRDDGLLGDLGESVQDIVEGVVGRGPKKNLFDDPDYQLDEKNKNAGGRKLQALESDEAPPGVRYAPSFHRTVLAVVIDHSTSHGPKHTDIRHIRIILYLLHARPDFTWMARLRFPQNSEAEKQLVRESIKEHGQSFFSSNRQMSNHGVQVGNDEEITTFSDSHRKVQLFLNGHAYLGYSKVAFDAKSLILTNHEIDGVSVAFPSDPDHFLKTIYNSRFIDCNQQRAKRFNEQFAAEVSAAQEKAIANGRGIPYDQFREEAKQLLQTVHAALDPLGVRWWINSGTLLGWYRQCDIIPYGFDVDIGIPIEDFSEDMVTALAAKGLRIKHRLGLPEWGLEISFLFKKIKLDIFFFYTEGNTMWNGGTQVKSGKKFKYTFPRVELCAAELLETRVGIPCKPLAHIRANYGDNWFTPVTVWDWKTSPSNVEEAGVYSSAELPKAVQIFIAGP